VSETPDPAPDSAPADGRGPNVFERFFPGPAQRDPAVAARLEAIARATERRAQHAERHQRADGRRPGHGQGPAPLPPTTSAPAASSELADAAPASASSPDVDRIADLLAEQTDILRAVLDADIAVRDDARATAQNSRTYAIAGTIIAFFTMVAAVVTVVIAFAH
jgi:hypothetical protein